MAIYIKLTGTQSTLTLSSVQGSRGPSVKVPNDGAFHLIPDELAQLPGVAKMLADGRLLMSSSITGTPSLSSVPAPSGGSGTTVNGISDVPGLSAALAAKATAQTVTLDATLGNNSTDSTSALTAAAAAVAPYGVVKIPPGTYRYSGNLTGIAGVRFEGSGRGTTILRNTSTSNPGFKMYGSAGGPYLVGAALSNLTLDAVTLTAGQAGLDVLLAQAFTATNVEVKNYGIGVQHKASWENLYSDVHVNACTVGWNFPAFAPYTPSSPITLNACHAVNCGTALNIVDGVQSLTWNGGDFTGATTAGAVIDGANTGQITLIGVNFEEGLGDDIVFGSTAGPANVNFIGCRLYSTAGKARSVWFRNGEGLNFVGCRWTGITKVLRQENTTGAATFSGCGGYGYTTFADLNGTTSDVSSYLVSSAANGVGGVGPGANGVTNTLKANQWLASKVIYGAGKVSVLDSDFTTAPVEGALVGVYNTTDNSFRLAQRHYGAWVNLPTTADVNLSTGLPSYVTGVKYRYDAVRNAYNWKASNTRNLRASLDRATRGTGKANHVFIGDSETGGFLGASSIPAYDTTVAWPSIYSQTLANLGVPVSGTGFCPASNNGATSYDPRWNVGTGWTNQAYLIYTSTSGKVATFTSTTPGTSVTIYYNGAGGGMKVNIDGGADVVLTMDGTSYNKVQTITGLANTTHTVVVTTTAASYNALYGVSVNGGNGLTCHNVGVGGSRAYGDSSFLANWVLTTQGYMNSTLLGSLAAASITPDVVYIALGVNDLQVPTAIPTIISALTTLRAQFSSSDVVLVVEYQTSGYTWNTWAAALYTLADTLDVPLIDLYDRSGGYTVANANGLMGGDIAHPNAKGQKDWGQLAASLAADWSDALSPQPLYNPIVLTPTGVAATDGPAMDAAVITAMATGRPIYLKAGTFRRTTEWNLRTAASLRIEGAGKDTGTLGKGTLIECTVDTVDLIGLGGFGNYLSDFTIRHSNFTPSASMGSGISFYKNAYSVIERVDVYNAYNLFNIPQIDVQDLGSGSGTGNYGFFSNTFSDMGLHNYYNSALWLHGYNGAMTGSVFTNIYIQNGTVGAALTSASNPVDIFVCDEMVFNQLNIEDHTGVGIGILLNQGQALFNGLHFERVPLTGYQPQYVRSYGSSQITINEMTVGYGDFAAAGTSSFSCLFSVAAGASLYAKSIWIHECSKTGGTPWYVASGSDTSAGNTLIVDGTPMVKSGSPAFTSLANGTYANGLRRIGDAIFKNIVSVTSAVTLTANTADQIVLVGASGVPTLPTAVGNTTKYTVKNVDTTNKTLATTSSQTIDGATTLTIGQNISYELISDGSNWKVV